MSQGKGTAVSGDIQIPPGIVSKSKTHQRIVVSALSLFANKGFHGTGIREIALESGVSTATLYHHIGTKEKLLAHLMTSAMSNFIQAAGMIVAQVDDPREQLSQLVRIHVVTHAHFQEISVVVDNEFKSLNGADSLAVLQLRDEYEDAWVGAIAAGMTQGYFNTPDARLTRIALLDACTGVANWFSPHGTYSIAQVAQLYVKMAQRILAYEEPQTNAELTEEILKDIWGIEIKFPVV